MRKKMIPTLAAVALAVAVTPHAVAGDPHSQYPGRDRGLWHAARYDQLHAEPGPHIPTPPKDPDAAVASTAPRLAPSSASDAAVGAVGFSGGRAGRRTVREVERDSVRQTIRRLG